MFDDNGEQTAWAASLDMLPDLKTTERRAILITVSKEIYSRVKLGTARAKSLAKIAVAMSQMLELY